MMEATPTSEILYFTPPQPKQRQQKKSNTCVCSTLEYAASQLVKMKLINLKEAQLIYSCTVIVSKEILLLK
jgi:hypothetical protein